MSLFLLTINFQIFTNASNLFHCIHFNIRYVASRAFSSSELYCLCTLHTHRSNVHFVRLFFSPCLLLRLEINRCIRILVQHHFSRITNLTLLLLPLLHIIPF